ncbi:MAG: hypothetical protein AAFO04_19130 [Cyanobacteria bacterium J06592_8]
MSTIRGSVFQDTIIPNGIFDLGEGLPNVTVFLDENGDGLPGELEAVTITDFNGEYTFSDVPAGAFIIDQVTPPGFNEPVGVPFSIVTTGDPNERIDFNILNASATPPVGPVPTAGTLSGAVFVDNNINGIYEPFVDEDIDQFGEPTLADGFPGATVFLDLNNSGFLEANEPFAETNEAGFYIFQDLPPATYLVRAELPSGFELQEGSVLEVSTLVGPNTRDIGVINPDSIYGRVIRDLNGNGLPEPSEPGQANIDVTITDGDGNVDTTTTDDEGFYIIDGLDTSIPGEDDPQNPFAQFVRDNEPERFAESFTVKFDVPTNAYVFTSPLLDPNGERPGEISITVTEDEARQINSTLVFNAPGIAPVPNSISGVIFNDLNANSLLDIDPITGVQDPPLEGVTVYLDLDDDGSRDDDEPTTTSDFNGNFIFFDLPPTPNIDPLTGFAPAEDAYVVRVAEPDIEENLTTPVPAITLDFGEAAQITAGLSNIVPFPPNNQFAVPEGGIDQDALIPVRGFDPLLINPPVVTPIPPVTPDPFVPVTPEDPIVPVTPEDPIV